MAFKHKSVLLDETIEGLNIKPDGIYVDGTLGGGGHAYEVCRRLNNKGSFIGIDQDAAAIEAAGTRLSDFGERVTIIRSNYCDMKSRLHEKGIDKVDGIVLDLGVSSYQLDTADRGFSYRVDAPLDMRMDTRQTLSAKEIVNGYSEMDLFRIIRDYGEDKFAKNIAKHIVMAREKGLVCKAAAALTVSFRDRYSVRNYLTYGDIMNRIFSLSMFSMLTTTGGQLTCLEVSGFWPLTRVRMAFSMHL